MSSESNAALVASTHCSHTLFALGSYTPCELSPEYATALPEPSSSAAIHRNTPAPDASVSAATPDPSAAAVPSAVHGRVPAVVCHAAR